MVDFVSREKRGNIMRGSRSKNTKPEIAIRKILHSLGYRYRLHVNDLPGKPDLAFRNRKKAIFVHGCFWHQHAAPNCPIVRVPASNTEFWHAKFDRNRARDAANEQALLQLGWSVLTLWECDLSDASLESRVLKFLGPQRA